MKNTLVVVSDLGGFKAYRLDADQMNSTPRLDLLEEFNNAAAHRKMNDRLSDVGGRFPRRTGASNGCAMSDGERHNIELESRRRHVRQMATRLNSLMQSPGVEQCYLAASREMNHQLLEELNPDVRAKIGVNVSADLMKVDKSELLRHFRARAVTLRH
jgi:hypothetical protein